MKQRKVTQIKLEVKIDDGVTSCLFFSPAEIAVMGAGLAILKGVHPDRHRATVPGLRLVLVGSHFKTLESDIS